MANPVNIDQYNDSFWFIHIPKTGGTTVKSSLRIKGRMHKTVREVDRKNKKSLHEVKVVSFVREPINRFISSYNYLRQKKIIDSTVGINDFIREVKARPFTPLENSKLLYPQTWFLSVNEKLKIDFIGYFEFLEQDILRLAEYLNINVDFIYKRNSSNNYANFADIEKENVYELMSIYNVDYSKFYVKRKLMLKQWMNRN